MSIRSSGGADFYQASSIDARLREMQKQYQEELKEQGKNMPGMNGAGVWKVEDEALQRKMDRLPSRYFDAIKRSLSKSAGQDEIIKDIEMRIAEIISDSKIWSTKA